MFDTPKTRMIGLLHGEKNYNNMLAVFIEYRNAADGQTDRQMDEQTELLYQYRASVC